jgi:anaerobic magnesium-protoporphyrin IX monomethyl ester cyclase
MTAALASAGCREAWLGAESGSQRVLDRMNKGTTVAELIEARRRLGDAGVRVGFFIQLGYLDEHLADLLATRELVQRAAPDDIGVSVSYPLPGTKFYEEVKSQLGRKTHWRDSDDLAMMFRGAYDSDFYRQIRDLLHEQVNLLRTDDGNNVSGHARKRSLDTRWSDLLSRERAHRTEPLAKTSLAALQSLALPLL